MSKTDAERRAQLARITGLDLEADQPALVTRPVAMQPAPDIKWAPDGVDPHTMRVTDIVFDPRMVEHFPDLSPTMRNDAQQYLFARYKAYGRNKERNSHLHQVIKVFLAQVYAERTQPGGRPFVKDKIRLANTLAEHDVTAEDLEEFLAFKRAQAAKE